MFATLPPSAMRMELTRLVCGRLELPESVAERLLAREQPPRLRARRCAGVLSRREETERTFLVLCLASPEEGARALARWTWRGTSPASCCGAWPSICARRPARADEGSAHEDLELRACWPSWSCRPAASRPSPRCSRCSACSWSWPAWTARSRPRAGRAPAMSASWRARAGTGQARVRRRVRAGARGDGGVSVAATML